MTEIKTISDLTPDSASAQVDSSLPVILTSADTDAATTIQNLGMVQQARLSRLSRIAASSTGQYPAGSTQVTAAQAAVTSTQSAISRINLVHQQVTTPAPVVTASGWTLHGRVYDNNLNPLSGYSVFLVDSQKNYLSAYGFAYTDSTGYFLISYAGSTTATTATQPATGAPAQPATTAPTQPTAGAPAPAGTAMPAATAMELYLQIADTKANPALLSATAFQPVVGNATYQVVTLPAGEPALGDPPAQVRAVALPPIDKKEGTKGS
jgi:hypothetical protein